MSTPRILFFDLETAGVGSALKADLGFILMAGIKWSNRKTVKVISIKKKDLRNFDDSDVCRRLAAEYTKADLVVAHYGSVFDRRMFQGRLLIHNLPPIPQTILRDTCLITRSFANFSSNRLGYLAKILKLPYQKIENGWPERWMKVLQGNMAELRAMKEYCKYDVLTLEALYDRIRPFDNAHPRLDYPAAKCGACGGRTERRGYRYAKTRRYVRYQCLTPSCQKWGQGQAA